MMSIVCILLGIICIILVFDVEYIFYIFYLIIMFYTDNMFLVNCKLKLNKTVIKKYYQ